MAKPISHPGAQFTAPLGRLKTCSCKTRLPKLVMPGFPYEDDHKGPSERSKAQAGSAYASLMPPPARWPAALIWRKTLEIINLNKKASFGGQFSPQILRVTTSYKMPFICMKPGQAIEPHPSGEGIFYIVSGKGVMTIDGKEVDVKAGDLIFVDKGESRGIRAVETMTAFAVHLNS